MAQVVQLPNNQFEGLAVDSNFTTAATLIVVASNALPWGKFIARHTGTAGFWYGRFAGQTPTASVYDFILGPGDPFQLDNPPLGGIKILSSTSGIGSLAWSLSYRT